MKRSLLLGGVLLLAAFLGAQTEPYPATDYTQFPAAATDEVLAPMVNPAALGFGSAGGFGYLRTYNDDSFTKQYSLLFNLDNLAYVYERTHGEDYHNLAMGNEVFRNLYVGMGWGWHKGEFSTGEAVASTLWRPVNALSLATVSSFPREGDDVHRLGVGVRPLYLNGAINHRVTFTGDIEYCGNGWRDPIFGIQAEPIDGLLVGGSYDSEDETLGATFRLAFGTNSVGSTARFDKDNEFDNGLLYEHMAFKSYRTPVFKFGAKRFYEMNLTGKLVDRRSFMQIGPFQLIRKGQINLHNLITRIEELRDDPAIDGIVVRKCAISGGFSDYQELAEALNDFRAAGKKVVFYFDNASNMNYIFAANVADEIYLNPLGSIDLKGMSLSLPFVGELADTLGIEFVNLQSHETKTAFNFLSDSKMPDAERASYELVFGDIYQSMLNMLEDGRGDKLTKPAADIVNGGPYMSGQTMLDLGLVDGLIYADELDDTLDESYGRICKVKEYDSDKMAADWSKPEAPRVAVIFATGNIHMGSSLPGSSIGSETLSNAIRAAREDDSVKGIILRVNSGGGSAQASDIITRQVRLATGEGKTTKPLVVSMGGAAASGGYYISTYANHIIAEPGTITGSIGVTGLLPNIAGLLRKVRVNFETVRFGDHSDIGAFYRAPTADEMQLLKDMINESYHTFVQHVATGRGMTYEEVDAIAQGRIWTGNQAVERGLVDELGGLNDAEEWMKQELGVQHLTVVEFTGKEDKFRIPVEADLPTGPFGSLPFLPQQASALTDTLRELMGYGNEHVLYRWSLAISPEFE